MPRAHAKSLSRGRLCDPMDHSPPGSSVHRILQARRLQWVAVASSRGSSPPRDQACICYVSCVGRWLFTTGAAREAHMSGGDRCLVFISLDFQFWVTVYHKLNSLT